jgi:hypothetical protein
VPFLSYLVTRLQQDFMTVRLKPYSFVRTAAWFPVSGGLGLLDQRLCGAGGFLILSNATVAVIVLYQLSVFISLIPYP